MRWCQLDNDTGLIAATLNRDIILVGSEEAE